MPIERRTQHPKRSAPPRSAIAVVGGGLALALVVTGCQSGPVQAFRGARHYEVGTEALERGEGERAISELHRAAELVPHASEIQNHLGLAYWSEGRIESARSAFELAIELDCDNQAARTNLAHLMNGVDVFSFAGQPATPQGDESGRESTGPARE